MYYLYIVECADGTLYTGITTHLNKRLAAHNSPVAGAKYTKTRQPVRLVFVKRKRNRSTAQREEYMIKRLSRSEKLQLIDAYARTNS